jgi:hypothetical protein
MESYTFNITEYHNLSRNFKPLEDLCYRRIIDWLYLNERPLPLNISAASKLLNLQEFQFTLYGVLVHYFENDDHGYFSRKINNELKPKLAKPKGTRLTSDWIVPDEYLEFCNKERPDLQASYIAEQFKDYWISVSGAKGTKLDWFATWRNWVRGQKVQPTMPSKFKNKSSVISDEHFEHWLKG